MTLGDLERIAREQLWPPGYKLHDRTNPRFDVYILNPPSVVTPDGSMLNIDGRDPEVARVAAWAHFDALQKHETP